MPQQQITYQRNSQGFTLTFALILCIIFASLLTSVLYFIKLNSNESAKGLYKTQAIYLAESGNARAMSQLNVKSLPEIKINDTGATSADSDEDPFEGDFDDKDFTDFDDDNDDFNDGDSEEDSDFYDEEDSKGDSNEERKFLAEIPRYINFYHENPFFINIDKGQVVTEAQYYSLVETQRKRIELNRAEGIDVDKEIPIEELYFPLPEVNVKKIGSIKIAKNIQLKPGFKLVLADKVKVNLKQKSILEEYYNFVPSLKEQIPRPILNSVSPNFAMPGDYLDVHLYGENIEDLIPETSSLDLKPVNFDGNIMGLEVSEKAKPGRYKIKFGPAFGEFYVVPIEIDAPVPSITDINYKDNSVNKQFNKMFNKDTLKNVVIKGFNLSDGKNPPIIVPDDMGITIDIDAFSKTELTCTIKTTKASIDDHYLQIFTEGGRSNTWTFKVEDKPDEIDADPMIATYSTVLTLLEIKSLANMPFSSTVQAGKDAEGRPEAAGGGSGRPSDGDTKSGTSTSTPIKKKNFDLLKSDLDTVWKLETIATVNKVSYKETKIIRRSVPQVGAALTTNSEISFGQSSIVIQGLVEALTRLIESSSYGDTKLLVEGESSDTGFFDSRTNDIPPVPSGKAVVEKFYFGNKVNTPEAKGFTPGALISIAALNRGNLYKDINTIKSVSSRSITVTEPGFEDSHFVGDEVIQFKPAVIFPYEISDREAERSLDPPGTFVNLPGKTEFTSVFRTKLDKISNWSGNKTRNTKVPNNQRDIFQGYFGLNIIEGVPNYSGGNVLYGQGKLIIDTTLGGQNPGGGVVTIGGGSKSPSIFDGVIYIIGELQFTGPVEISGGVIVNSPNSQSTLRVSGAGTVSYNPQSVNKSILHLPFTEELHSRVLIKAKSQEEILKQ